ncbi:hypothetical protein WJX74_007783 [Apatococcus lobatus]|uniref:Uncharacterized protein n=1 Tax=Apatococcus lobatus TaxID=904363 RepID=A0AAW1QLV9_9CHLO
MLAPPSSPGGPKLSGTKKRRLAALEESLGSTKQQTKADSSCPTKPAADLPSLATTRARHLQRHSKDPQSVPYNNLDEHVSTGPLATVFKMQGPSKSGRAVEDLLTQPSKGNEDIDKVQQAISLKVSDHTLMLDNPASAQGAKPADASGRCQHLLSQKACKELNLYNVANQRWLSFEMFVSLHTRWKQYIRDLTCNQTGVEDRLLTADLHGSLICVEFSRQVSHLRREGIVIQSKLNTFCIIGHDNFVFTVPKAGSTFSYWYMPHRKVMLNGSKLASYGM